MFAQIANSIRNPPLHAFKGTDVCRKKDETFIYLQEIKDFCLIALTH